MFIDILITVLVTLLCFILYYVFVVFNYWPNQGIPNIKPTFPFGNIGDITKGKISFTDQIGEFYNIAKLKGWDFLGLNFFHRKVLLILDPDLGKRVLSTDFKYFHSRGIYVDEENDPLTAHLVSLNGTKWKNLRTKLTPTFTPNKLKTMFEILLNCANEMSAVIKETNINPQKICSLEVKDISSRYTTDVVGSSAFGIECNSIKNPDTEFRKIGLSILTPPKSKLQFLKRLIIRNFPSFSKKLKLKSIDPSVTSFFLKIVKAVVDYRRQKKILRNDFLQLLMNLMPSGTADDEDALTIKQVAAQCFVFFFAGVETSAGTITFALYELAKNKKLQDKVRREINEVYEECGGKLTYDGVTRLEYMEKVILETLRKYPAFTVVMRKCTEDYRLPNSKGFVPKGSSIIVPVYAMQHDPDYFPNPQEFDPERFNEEEIKKRKENVYLPFGDGPRICIGRRFAMFQIKLALATTLKDFMFTVNEKSKGEIEMDKSTFILTPRHGIYLDVTPIESYI